MRGKFSGLILSKLSTADVDPNCSSQVCRLRVEKNGCSWPDGILDWPFSLPTTAATDPGGILGQKTNQIQHKIGEGANFWHVLVGFAEVAGKILEQN